MCPFVDKADARCAAHLTFRNIASAFEHCADQYTRCQVYRELLRGLNDHEPPRQAVELLAAS